MLFVAQFRKCITFVLGQIQMNEKIQHIIQEIRVKKSVLEKELNQSVQKNGELEQEVNSLNKQLVDSKTQIAQLNQMNSKLIADLEMTKNQVIDSGDSSNRNLQIDELVREIEYCIGQLKNNA